ncbi:hypothetical protein F4818DRAFT_226430 [Hypoxylon cercidicola]|nr:hypothetical protein F4818DRAFT_226430 [Hypoxylon cercidicola]
MDKLIDLSDSSPSSEGHRASHAIDLLELSFNALDGGGNPSTTSADHHMAGYPHQTGYPQVHIATSHAQVTRAETGTQPAPAPLEYPGPPPGVIPRKVSSTQSGTLLASPQVQANYIVSHTPEMAAGVVEAVHKELARANSGDGKVELRQTDGGSYMRVIVPSKNIMRLINAARSVTEELTEDSPTERPGTFQEPPVIVNKDFRILLEIDSLTNNVRPRLQLGKDTPTSLKLPEDYQGYTKRLSEYIYKGLKTAGRLPLPLTLRAHLGHYMLRTYPLGKVVYEYNDFHTMIKHPRASGWLKTRIGDETLAQRVLDFARNDTNGVFQPISNQSTSAADILPEYSFEVHSQRAKFYTPLQSRTGVATKGVGTRDTVVYHPYRVITCGVDASFAELDIVNLSVGKKLDWKFEAVTEEKGEKTFPDVVKYLRSLEFDLRTSNKPHDLNVYPRLRPQNGTDYKSVAAKLKDAAMKTVYNFRWKSTSYVVQIAVNHRWDSVGAMKRGRPTVDVGMSVFGEYWDLEEDTAGNVWGDELQFLLEGDGNAAASGPDRVGNFLQVIQDVRDTVHTFF